VSARPLASGVALALWLALGLAAPAGAQDPRAPSPLSVGDTPLPRLEAAPPEAKVSGFIETGLNYHILTDGQEDWFGQYVRGAVDIAHTNIVTFEVVHQEEFGDDGTFFGLGLTHVLDPDWFASLNVGTSAGGFFWPRVKVDAFVSRKWLEQRRLVTTIGFGYYDAKDVHYDFSAFIGAAYYFESPWIVEGGLRYNFSQPGNVTAPGPFAAVTYGRNKAYYIVLRVGIGREAYQVVGQNEAITDFASQVVTLTWRQWLTPQWGFKLQGEYYHNPFYERVGFEAGIFWDF
jgi:YaiO family outer membrane protein